MTDTLRTRIAAAIYEDNGFGWSKYMCEEAADAVIAELGLRQEFVHRGTGSPFRYVTDLIPGDVLKTSKPHWSGITPQEQQG